MGARRLLPVLVRARFLLTFFFPRFFLPVRAAQVVCERMETERTLLVEAVERLVALTGHNVEKRHESVVIR